MVKFHVNRAGNPGKCSAQEGNCPFGDADKHFDSMDDARKEGERVIREEYDNGLSAFRKSDLPQIETKMGAAVQASSNTWDPRREEYNRKWAEEERLNGGGEPARRPVPPRTPVVSRGQRTMNEIGAFIKENPVEFDQDQLRSLGETLSKEGVELSKNDTARLLNAQTMIATSRKLEEAGRLPEGSTDDWDMEVAMAMEDSMDEHGSYSGSDGAVLNVLSQIKSSLK